ncbi:MAG: hydrogenase small subunit [Actinobacteria bacterium]|nr:hydrogenase small subunit [Actinomycetota bacterium]MBU1944167.1 hydrogenase small subunit [Actinomycetota bacterium]MBU2687486.1 hydrogenase small subunit [Actinomycetota bacterium]
MPEKDEIEHIASEHLDAAGELAPEVHEHLDELLKGAAPVIWVQGQNCTGCSVTLFSSDHYSLRDLFFGKFSLRYHPTLMSSEGFQAIDQIEKTEREAPGRYLVVLEGTIPTGEGEEFCTFGLTDSTKHLMGRDFPADRTAFDWLVELIPGAEAVLAVGNCAAFGGIPTMESQVTGATSATDVVEAIDGSKPVINVAGCPPHPDWIIGTLIDLLLWVDGHKGEPVLDDRRCLLQFYEAKIHDQCPRKPAFEAKRFLTDWNDVQPDEDRCLLRMGCRGPSTRGDCPTRLWNFGTSWCVGVNAPCQGCTNPDFYNKLPHPK